MTWESPLRLREELLEIGGQALGGSACEFIWCAGRAGFTATASETDCEFGTFETVLEWVEGLAAESADTQIGFSLISSAGGLFEGQPHVDEQSPVCPRRPYGCLKLQQERRLRESRQLLHRHVYRPSSVYGWLRPGQRKGLIPTLIYNGLRNHESSFDGSFNTLRDYIWVGDVAEIVVGSLFGKGQAEVSNSTRFVVSGQPNSIFQIKQLVEATIGRRLQLKFVSKASNARDTTFSASCVRDNQRSTDMSVAIRRIAADFSSNGVLLDARRQII